ncbi:hypothetical protein BCIN_07g05650 [Botrytis cinerea B05.10]|uniref:SMODS and SLOG-associating 2TM effector domain-containing protein n=2 Tax=Botryotinia fuckeliana TaxID=40559 RepID=A0A384JN76_BOTFB|nr:hypothetical protein BCIN_07g05650 [Botrytis cinerea B05.10]ATZ52039.1 hypothetical protein BCIN_07g05650 [Botrytis cinerea B05.10]CCD55414.1 hypothetical protein BofuT4_P158100.1 [Botrytis cinerea T4]
MFEARLERKERVKPQSLGVASDSKRSDDMVLDTSGLFPIKEPFFVTAKFWKRFSVYASVILSVASLVISSIASLKPTTAADMKALIVTSIIINALSVTLSALTSLDWQSQATTDRQFAQMLSQISHVHDGKEGGRIVVLGREREREEEERMMRERGVSMGIGRAL